MKKNFITGAILAAFIMLGILACNGGKTIKYNDIAGPSELRELEDVQLSVEGGGGTGTSIEWRVDPSDAGEFSPGVGSETIFRPNAVSGPRNATINSIITNDQHGTIVKRKDVTITDNTGWITFWGRSTNNDEPVAIETGADGTNYILGNFINDIVLNINGTEKILQASGSHAVFLIAVDAAGDVLWGEGISYPVLIEASSLLLTPDGRLLSVFGHGSTNIGLTVIREYDLDGNLQWEVSLPVTTEGLDIDSDGNFYITGNFSDTVDFDPGASVDSHTAANLDAFLCSYFPDGSYRWGKSWGGSPQTLPTFGIDLAVSDKGNLYVAGRFRGDDVDFDPDEGVDLISTTDGYESGFLAFYSTEGEYLSARSFGGDSGGGWIDGLEVDDYGNVFVSGSAWGDMDLDLTPEVYSLYAPGLYLVKYNSQLDLEWADFWNYQAWGSVHFRSLIPDDEGGVIIAGDQRQGDAWDFDPGPGEILLRNEKGSNGFILKLDSQGAFESIRTYGENFCWVSGVDVDIIGNTYLTGSVWGRMEFNTPAGYSVTGRHTSNFLLSTYD